MTLTKIKPTLKIRGIIYVNITVAYLRQSEIVSRVCFAIEIKPLKPCYIKGPCFPLLTLFCFSILSVSKVSESYLPLVCFSLRQINTCQ